MTVSKAQLDAIGRPIIIASHQRSGTHLTIDLLRKHFPDTNPKLKPLESLHHLYIDMDSFAPDHHNPMSVETALRLLSRNPRPIIKTHALPTDSFAGGDFEPVVKTIFERAQILNVVRDGRSVMPSLQLFEQPWNPDAHTSFSEFIRSEYEGLERPKYWERHVRSWQSTDRCFTVRFDRIIKDTEPVLIELGEFLGMTPTMKKPLLPVAMKSHYEGWLRRLIGSTETTTIPGAGKSPKWWDKFTDEDRVYFDDLAGDLLIELGYEPDHAWAQTSEAPSA